MKKELKIVFETLLKYGPVLITVCAFLLRIFRGPELFFWNIDEDIVGLTVKRMLVEHRLQLIGFPIPGGIYLGPLYYYLISVPYFLSGFHPERFFIFSALLGALVTFLTYKVGRIIFEKRSVGLVASTVFAFSYFATTYGRLLSGLSIAPILALLTYLILYQNLKFKKPMHLILLGIILLVAVQNEGSSFSLVALFLVTWLIYGIRIPKLTLFSAVAIFVLFHIPLLVFDLRHNFHITKSFLGFFSRPGTVPVHFSLNSLPNILQIFPNTLARLLYPTGPLATSKQILPCPDLTSQRIFSIPYFAFIFAIFILAFFFLSFVFKKDRSIGEKIIFFHFCVVLVGIVVFNFFLNGYLFEWILIVFLPALCFMVGLAIDDLFRRKIVFKVSVIVLGILFIWFNLRATLSSHDDFGVLAKSQAVKYAVEKLNGRQFNLDSIGSCFPTGYLYLFWLNGNFPVTSFEDDMFSGTFYQKAIEKPKTTVVIANPSDKENQQYLEKYNLYKSEASSSKKIGTIEVMIIEDNK